MYMELMYVFAFYIILNIYVILNKQNFDSQFKLDDILDRAIDKSDLDEFGTWKVDDENYPVSGFIIKRENITERKYKNDRHSVCSKCEIFTIAILSM